MAQPSAPKNILPVTLAVSSTKTMHHPQEVMIMAKLAQGSPTCCYPVRHHDVLSLLGAI